MKKHYLAAALAASFILSAPSALAKDEFPSELMPGYQRVSAMGEVVAAKPISSSVTSYLVNGEAGEVIFHALNDGSAFFAGFGWSTPNEQKRVILPRVPDEFDDAPYQFGAGSVARMDNVPTANQNVVSASSSVPESMRVVDGLAGWTEGSATDIDKILYVLVDPRCPYCRAAYMNLRPYVEKGVTVRWISTQALGRSPEAAKLAAAINRGGREAHDILSHSKKQVSRGFAPVTSAEQEQMKASLDFLFDSFNANPAAGSAGVPVAYYVSKSGEARMLKGLSEKDVVKQVMADSNL